MPVFGKKKPEDMKDEDLIKKGQEAVTTENWEMAIEYLRIFVKRNPQIIPTREVLTYSLIQEQKVNEALEHVRYLLNIDDQNPSHYLHLGSCYQLQGKIDDAIKEFAHSLELKEDPFVRGMMLYLKTPTIPLVNLDALQNGKASLLARSLSSIDMSHNPEIAELSEKMQKIGSDMQDKIIDAQDSEVFMKKIADTCIDRSMYAEVSDLLKKYKNMDEIKIQLQILESKSEIKGRFAQFQNLNFVHFEKIESK
ncbi:MAG: hypothetical protein E4H14_07305 [Candidatus Thorarchaeota archaeon]|nr:MAG: hypothetical protein E4H14_07305 [Candidatus Thorarchaeota archaeon]